MRSERLLIVAMLISMMVLAVPLMADDSSASATVSSNGVNITIFDDSVSLNAGSTTSTKVSFTNTNTSTVAVHISCTDNCKGAFSTSVDNKEFNLQNDEPQQITINVTTDRLSQHGKYTVNVNITIVNYETGVTTDDTVIPVTVEVLSSYSSDVNYNRIFGIFDPIVPFDAPICTAAITMGLWIGIAIGLFIAFHAAVYFIFKGDKEIAREISVKTGSMIVISVLFYGLSNALMVYGAPEVIIAFLQNLASFLYIPIIAYIVWNIYTNVIKLLFHRLEEQDRIAGADTSLIPLFNMLGKIVIIIVATSALLGTMGFDLVAIITGAGIAGMAISLGAQSTLTEFFSGLNLLSTRPFKRGDMVTIGGKDIYQVEKVGLLNSRFKNWINLEYIVIPNSTVVSSTIVNITGKTMSYRLFLYYTVAYDSDVETVKQILLDTAYNHPQVIVDGSCSGPDVRLTAFEDSAIKFRLAVYITDFRDHITVTDELNEDVYRNLCKAGIEIPYNKLDVYIKDDGDSQ